MLTEGVGMRAPAPISVRLTRGDIVFLSSIAARRDKFRRYASRADAWGRGFVCNPIFTGLCGEHALCRFLNGRCGLTLSVDSQLRIEGDGGRDLEIAGLVIQVKTRASGRLNLIRRVSGTKHLMPLACEAFVFAALAAPIVRLLGWITASDAARLGLHQRSPVADHFNLRIKDSDLAPMARLVEEIEYRRAP